MSTNRRDNNRPDMRGVMRKSKEIRPDKKMSSYLKKNATVPIRKKIPALRRKSLKKR